MSAARDWTDLALAAGGRSLIQASAGTGKTWTISVLYLRLLLEERLGPAQIVVTTFTDAAAQELRERIRARIARALQLAQAPDAAADAGDEADVRAWLQQRWRAGEPARRGDRHRLLLAQAELDRAPIGTLHALCRRILADHPFESGSPFRFGDPVTPDAIHNELIDDLQRRLSQSAELDADDEVWRREERRTLERYLRLVLAPGVGVAPVEAGPVDAILPRDEVRRLEAWLQEAQFIRGNSRLKTRLSDLARLLAAGAPRAPLPGDIDEVLADPPEKHLRASTLADPATTRVLAFARRAADALSALADQPRARALARYRFELRARCRERLAASGRMTFDELIERVHAGLTGAGGGLLADRLFAAWPVALVDEFQDTDLQQYAILDRVYRDGAGAARGRLVMIGDPKQAIYRFRGGDIDTYLQARGAAGSTLELGTNFRSSRHYVRALNALYAAAGAALSVDPAHPIRYAEVTASARRDAAPYRIDGKACTRPLQFHYGDGDALPGKQEERVEAALTACANQVVELLSGRHAIGARALQPGDIAVLLPTRAQVLALRAALRERNVPCVVGAWSSVFDSPWARELRIVLHAALHPRDDGAVRAALATRLGGRNFAELRDERDDAQAWQREVARFERHDRLWQRRGVLALVQALTAAATARLFAGDDGERALTDLRHLGELLQARSDEVAGREELLAWFADECERAIPEAAEAAADERQLRIETDAARVRLLTLHGAKGLEFEVVILPLMWANRQNDWDRIAVLHDADARERRVTFGAAALRRYWREGQDERFRLLYVALTRARHACHVYALSPARSYGGKRADGDPERSALDAMVEKLLRGQPAPAAIDHVRWSHGWNWPYAVWQPPRGEVLAAPRVLATPVPQPYEPTWSFSALLQAPAANAPEVPAAADEVAAAPVVGSDGESEAGGPEHAQLAWLAPIAGAEFGNAVHAIFERRAIGVPLQAQHALVRDCLREHGVGLRGIALDEVVAHLAARVQATLDTPLLAGDPSSALAALPGSALCVEMPFDFALGTVALARLREACDFVPPTTQAALRGLMTGKIDLVFEHRGRFHVLDYKSNRLGSGRRLSDFDDAALERAMHDDHYRFQALLYTLAVDRFLRARMPGYRRAAHLGETIYLFVRAVGIAPDAAPRAGIWAQRFDDALLDAVDAVLAGDSREAA
jgi:exodeoxyribonuclease V beta subunit